MRADRGLLISCVLKAECICLQKHPPEADSHPLWQAMRVLDGQGRDQTGTIFFNPYQGSFSQTAPPPPAAVRGGILAGDSSPDLHVAQILCSPSS